MLVYCWSVVVLHYISLFVKYFYLKYEQKLVIMMEFKLFISKMSKITTMILFRPKTCLDWILAEFSVFNV